MARLDDLDAAWLERSAAARANGATLKYVASVPAEGPIRVGVQEVADSLLGALQGENVVIMRTARPGEPAHHRRPRRGRRRHRRRHDRGYAGAVDVGGNATLRE
ncbi:MAG: hypothetical protein R2853_15880 [Thermomicrobiales bacterium]